MRPQLTWLDPHWQCTFGRITVTAPAADEALALMAMVRALWPQEDAR